MYWGNKAVCSRVGVCLTVAALCSPLSAHAAAVPGRRPHDVQGGISSSQIVVRLKEGSFRNPAMLHRLAKLGRDADPRDALGQRFQTESRRWRVTKVRPAYSTEFAHPDRAAKLGLDRTYIIEVPEGSDTEAMAEAFAQLADDVEVATVDTVGGVAGADPQFIPNDLRFGEQYAMHNGRCGGSTSGALCNADTDCGTLTCSGQSIQGSFGIFDADIDATEAWAIHTGDFGTVTIAILDTGLLSHNDLGTNAAPFPNGRIVQGRNTNNPLTPNLTIDEYSTKHGTHVSGIAAATGNNMNGVAGVTWGAYVMPVRVTNSSAVGTISNLSDGIRWAADNGADVANMSLQWYGITQDESNLLRDAIQYARSAGMLLVAATGNGRPLGAGVVAYPARMAGVMGVTATNNDDVSCIVATCGYNANNGNEVDLAAPGDNILSLGPNHSYAYQEGTSMASPHVAGLAALVKSYRLELTNVDLEFILIATAQDLGPVGWDRDYGFGRINAHQALLAAETWKGVVIGSDPPNGAIDARKPTDRDGTSTYGWQSLDLTMSVYASRQTDTDFVTGIQGSVASPPAIASVVDVGGETVHITFTQPIERSAWTTIEHLPSGIETRIGFLPGDVNGNRAVDAVDVDALRTALEAATVTRGTWSLDIDRSEAFTGADLLEVIDLYNGAEGYDVWFGAVLP